MKVHFTCRNVEFVRHVEANDRTVYIRRVEDG